MKKLLYSILIGSIALIGMGCEDEKNIPHKFEVSTSEWSFPATEGLQRMIVSAPGAWTITEVPDWMTVTPVEGPGTREIKITYATNPVEEPRQGTFVATCNGETITVSIAQAAKAKPGGQ